MNTKVTESSRLILRQIHESDAPFIVELVNSPGWLQFIGDRKIHDLEGARGYINKIIVNYQNWGYGLYVMELKDTKEPVGLFGLLKRDYLPAADIGYALLPEFEGLGLAFEAGNTIMEFAKQQLKMDTLFAIVTPQNNRSISLLKKLGFEFEKEILEDGTPLAVYQWNLFAKDQ